MLLFGYGIYLIYLHINMKNTGIIPKTLISNKIDLNKSKDIKGYIEHTYKKGIAFGIILSVCAAIMYFRDYFNTISPWIAIVANIMFFVIMIVYSVVFIKAQQKYLL